MKIYVCENYHDNDSGIFASRELALAYLDANHNECVQEYELVGEKFEPTDDCVRYWTCNGCKQQFRSDAKTPLGGNYHHPEVCDEACRGVFQKACDEHEAKLRERYTTGAVRSYS